MFTVFEIGIDFHQTMRQKLYSRIKSPNERLRILEDKKKPFE